MNHQRTTRYALLLCLLSLGLGGTGTARADMEYQVTVDTSTLDSQSGIISFEFLPGLSTYQSATATISGLMTDGTLSGDTVLYGGASGDLNPSAGPAQLVLNNTTAFNDGDQYLTYGTSITLNVMLSGPAITNPDGAAAGGSTFSFFVQDTNFNPLLTNSQSGSLLDLDITAGSSSVTATPYDTTPGGVTVATPAPAGGTPAGGSPPDATAPAPSGMTLALLAIASVITGAALRRRMRWQPATA